MSLIITCATVFTFAAWFGLIPRAIFGAVESLLACRVHDVTGVTAITNRLIERELIPHVDSTGNRSGISTADNCNKNSMFNYRLFIKSPCLSDGKAMQMQQNQLEHGNCIDTGHVSIQEV